jgi:hypothetical protein
LLINDYDSDLSLDNSALVLNVEKLINFRNNHSMSFVIKNEFDFIMKSL